MADFYAILGLRHTAEPDDIAKAYRRAALTFNPECHPDHKDPAELGRRFKLVSQAYVVLSDPRIRAVYDAYGEFGVLNGGTGTVGIPGGIALDEVDPGAVFRRFFGVDNPFQVLGDISGIRNNQHHFFSASAAVDKNPPQVSPVRMIKQVTLEEIFSGAAVTVEWTSQHTNAKGETVESRHSQEIVLNKGTAEGTSVVLKGKGSTKEGLSAGDVIVTFETARHERFTRNGDDLHVVVPVTLVEALCGVAVSVNTMQNRELQVLIDEIVHPKFEKRIVSEGMPRSQDPTQRGDLVIKCDIQFPKYLTAEQKAEAKRILSL